MSVNKVILVGHVGKDPEIRHLSDTKLANFSLATSETYTSKSGEKVTTTEWHNIVVWRGLAEVAEKFIAKGSQLYVEGKIYTRSYEKDGVKHYRTEIQADTVQLLGRKPEGSSQQPQAQPQPHQQGSDFGLGMNTTGSGKGEFDPHEDDLPF